MADSNEPGVVKVLESALSWTLAHPSFFFADGVANAASMVEQLVGGAKALGAHQIEVRSCGSWQIVAAELDWFASARFPVPEDLQFFQLTPFPELGQNSVRPECLVAAFAEMVVIHGPSGTRIVKGDVAQDEPVLDVLIDSTWGRAVAFRMDSA